MTFSRTVLLIQTVAGLALISFALRGLGFFGCLVGLGGLLAGYSYALLETSPLPLPATKPAPKPTRTSAPARPRARAGRPIPATR